LLGPQPFNKPNAKLFVCLRCEPFGYLGLDALPLNSPAASVARVSTCASYTFSHFDDVANLRTHLRIPQIRQARLGVSNLDRKIRTSPIRHSFTAGGTYKVTPLRRKEFCRHLGRLVAGRFHCGRNRHHRVERSLACHFRRRSFTSVSGPNVIREYLGTRWVSDYPGAKIFNQSRFNRGPSGQAGPSTQCVCGVLTLSQAGPRGAACNFVHGEGRASLRAEILHILTPDLRQSHRTLTVRCSAGQRKRWRIG